MGSSLRNLRCFIIAIVGASFMTSMAMVFYSSNSGRSNLPEDKKDIQKRLPPTDQANYLASTGASLEEPSTPLHIIKDYSPQVNLPSSSSKQVPMAKVLVTTSTVTVKNLRTERIEDHEVRQQSSSNVNLIEVGKTAGANRERDSTDPEDIAFCPTFSQGRAGALDVNVTQVRMVDVEKDMSSWVSEGGCWKPSECKARVKMSLIIPYRNRYEQLSILVRNIHPMLKRQNLDYRMIVIEQAGDTPFNRAMLFNIGYQEALKFDNYTCFVFHDVDLIPEDDRNDYGCPSSPRHLSVAVDKFDYRLPYDTIFGGAGSFTKDDFQLINGFSNQFWGWGGEDDDLFNRITAKGLKLTRPSLRVGRYKMLKAFHRRSSKVDPIRHAKLETSVDRMSSDGLNSLHYIIENLTEHPLYTLVKVDVKDALTEYNKLYDMENYNTSSLQDTDVPE